MTDFNSTRLNKYISEKGICSRREADRFIEKGNVFINGKVAKIGDQVLPGDRVVVNGQALDPKKSEEIIFLAFNKPEGITSTTELNIKGNIIDYVNHSQRIFPIGRLDKDSQGLIFLTNNGDIVNKILRAGNNHEKEYLVTVDKVITDQFIERMANGVPILGEMTRKCIVQKESPFIFRIILVQGLNRQIRRMCEHFQYEVIKLQRTRIMNISLKGLPVGDWRELSEHEMSNIFKLVEKSSSTVKTSNPRKSKKKANPYKEDIPELKKDYVKLNTKTKRGLKSKTFSAPENKSNIKKGRQDKFKPKEGLDKKNKKTFNKGMEPGRKGRSKNAAHKKNSNKKK